MFWEQFWPQFWAGIAAAVIVLPIALWVEAKLDELRDRRHHR